MNTTDATVVASAVTASPLDSTAAMGASASVCSSSAGVATKNTSRDNTSGVDVGQQLDARQQVPDADHHADGEQALAEPEASASAAVS